MSKRFIISSCIFMFSWLLLGADLNDGNTPPSTIGNFNYSKALSLNDKLPLLGQLSKDGLNMYITMNENMVKNQVYVLSRRTLNEEFGTPYKVKGIINDTKYNVTGLSVTADERTMVYVSSNDNSQSGNDLYIATRSSNSDQWVALRKLDEINDPSASDAFPWISPDGLRIYYTKQKGKDVELYEASRTNPSAQFSTLRKLDIPVPLMSNNLSCTLSNDELEMYIISRNNIYKTTRESIGKDFAAPALVGSFSENSYLGAITFTPDLRETYIFNSTGFMELSVVKYEDPQKRALPVVSTDGDELEFRD